MFGMGGTEILVILIVALLFLGPDKLPEAAKTISKGIRDIKKQSRVLQRTIEDDEHIGGAIRDLRSALRGEEEPYRPSKPKELDSTTSPTTEVVAAEPGSPQPDPLLGPGDPAQPDSGDSAEGGHMPNSMRGAAETSGAGSPSTATADTSTATADTSTGGAAGTSSGATSSGATSSGATSSGATSSGATSGGDAKGASSSVAGGASTAGASTAGASTASRGSGAATAASTPPSLTFPPTAGQPDDDAPPPSAAEDAALASLVKPAPNTIAHTPRSANEPSKSPGRKHG